MQNKDKWFKKKIMKQKKSYYFRSKLKKKWESSQIQNKELQYV
jgi:hypothetical protein|tara:strand:+ start:194 stop:322 length:129 start_codon:yes stop_codon:yes gene_type:complete